MHSGIRRLLSGDAASFRNLRLRALREHPEAFTSSQEEDEKLSVADTARRLQSEVCFLGAFDGASLCAIVGLQREQRAKNRHKATVVGMYVAPEARGRGLGRALVDTLVHESRAIGIELLVLTVTDGNTAATRLYERAGFRSFGTEPDAIRIGGRGFGKIHMFLQLIPS